MNILVVPDLHTKLYLFQEIKKFALKHRYDLIIFLGDYVDDWNTSPEASYNLLQELIRLKKKYPRKVILCAGNHDLSYCDPAHFKCSGYNEETHSLVKDLYKTKLDGNVPVFQFAYSLDNYLFTHAGMTNHFWKDLQILIKNHYSDLEQDFLANKGFSLACKISNLLNYIWLLGLTDPTDKLFLTMAQAGGARGGLGTPSPIWADKSELMADPLPFINQIVGHSPVKTITTHTFKNGDKSSNTLTFCDTHSLWYEPYLGITGNIGDNSLLEINDDTFRIIKKEGYLCSPVEK